MGFQEARYFCFCSNAKLSTRLSPTVTSARLAFYARDKEQRLFSPSQTRAANESESAARRTREGGREGGDHLSPSFLTWTQIATSSGRPFHMCLPTGYHSYLTSETLRDFYRLAPSFALCHQDVGDIIKDGKQ